MSGTTYFYKGMTWREAIDSLGHFLRLPRFAQSHLCDWVDRHFYDDWSES